MIYFLIIIFFLNIKTFVDIKTQNYDDKLAIFKKSLFIISIGNPEIPQLKIIKTIGTGIMFIYNEEIWGLASRHAIDPVIEKYRIKFFTKIEVKNTGKFNGVLFTFKKDKNKWFHPDDSENKTRDIALFFFGKISRISKRNNFFELPRLKDYPILNEKDTLLILGYPSKNLSYDVLYNKEMPLPITILQGVYLPYITNSETTNYNKVVMDLNHIAVENILGLKGMSGGLVLAKKGTSYFPVGFVSSAGSGRIINYIKSDTTKINYISFVHFKYVNDIFEKLNQYKN